MMKKLWIITICLAAMAVLAACGGSGSSSQDRSANQATGVNAVLEAGMAAEDAAKAENDGQESTTMDAQAVAESKAAVMEEEQSNQAGRQAGPNKDAPAPEEMEAAEMALSQAEGIDIDLTSLPSTMVYSEVYHMMVKPEDYIGKTVKMSGAFNYFRDEATGNEYFACVIQDATACCAQGIEFILSGDYSYPEDYPETGDEICVVGTFDTYTEGNYRYCTLRDAEKIL